ncbi:hypothetical protein [Xanthomonas citri]|uniref:hypothetical protein n=1 Tax=Xanthomonas citri TaxID=346 RepID=UPI0001CECE30|nr:hypothetical protein [Xanthomonas citri]AMV00308.1 hypothetical protein TP37_21120 [Xanthomonas citri pv. aurantifolii]EFF46483.1 hypothetical protein XAUC_31310 [Xanthomonas citri pv. aurantifolii str. ICPB 10535]MCC8491359.1 DUF3102 domain-containing protein [Xanthomonas citri pv. fuscans]TBW97624.1 hypothetical protein TP47_10755 [Xanthomonas citri pv. aurantifolii]TBX04205.1 hypothetical protein TP46_06630 [Xanthomonas citri pv. aurantifolii]
MAAAKKTAGRTALAPAEQVGPEFVGKTPADEAQQLEVLHERQTKLVEQFGDGLPWHPDHYEAAIRGELRRGCEAFLRAGRYLVVARECALHGEWQSMLDRLGMEPRQAQRMMEAARRIAALPNASTSTHLLAAAKSESKVIELLSLPEEQFAELAEHGETGDLSLEEVQQMTVRELRAAVREARADLDAKDQRINKLSDDLNKEHEKTIKAQRRWKAATPDEQLTILKQAVNEAEQNVLAALGGEKSGLRGAVRALASHASDNSQDQDAAVFLSDMIGRLLNATRLVRDDDELPLSIPVVDDGAEG